ncbi:hypothetical protein OROHE_016388 [Orobanche hederae]
MRIHNFILIFNEYDAILSPTYVGHIIIKVCVVGFGRTNYQFSRNTATSGFNLAIRIHDFGLSEENDAIILRTYVGHTIVKVCVVGFGRKTTNSQEMWNSVTYACNENSQFHTNSEDYDAVLLCSYVANVIIMVCVVVFGRKNNQFLRNTGTLEFRLANENPLFRPNFDNYYDVIPPSYFVHIIIKECVMGFGNNSDECGRNNNQFLRNTVTPGFWLAMNNYDFGPILKITMPFFHV